MKSLLLTIAFLIGTIAFGPSLCAQTAAGAEPDALEMSIEQNLSTPAVPSKARAYITTAMDQVRRMLIKSGLHVESIRQGEVLEVTMSCTSLFAPGAVEIKPSGAALLKPFSPIIREPQKYKIVVAVHSDDTGDEMYADSITAARANAVDDCLWELAGERDTNVIPYGLGKDEPKYPNNSRINREANRRVEIYIIPDEGLLEMAGIKRKNK